MIDVNRHTLANGLRIVHHRDSSTAMVALNLLYNVGSRDEVPDRTGMAHLFEHLMFGGSATIPNFDLELEAAGGSNNAWTNSDFTNFYDIVPAHNVETAFWLESDRMGGLAFSDHALEVQRQVVCEEFKQVCLNQPYGDMSHHLYRMAYTTHPYRTPVIGASLDHIEGVCQQDVRDFFYDHYAPDNAVLAVTGNITFERTCELAEKWFGPIPRRNVKPRIYSAEPKQTQARRTTAYGRVPLTKIVKAYHMPGYAHPDYTVCDIITDILAAGRTSRFYRRLFMGTGLYTNVDASILGTDEPGLLLLSATLREGTDIADAECRMSDEALGLVSEPPSLYELQRTINRFESLHTFGNINFANLAANLAMCEMQNDDINAIIPRYQAVKPDDVVRVASEIFTPENSSTLVYMPLSEDNQIVQG